MRKLFIFQLLIFSIAFSCAAQLKVLPFSDYLQVRNGLNHAYRQIEYNKKATVAFLGGSITFNEGWRNMVCDYLRKQYPDARFQFIAAGIPSLGSLPHAFRFQQDVLDSGKVDLLFLEAAVNDQVNGTDSITQVRALEGIIRHAKANNPKVDIIMMSFADPDKTNQYNQGRTPLSVANHEKIAAYYGLPSINLAKAVRDKLQNKEFDWNRDFVDLHPSPFGQKLYFEAIKTLLTESHKINLKKSRKKNSHNLPVPLDQSNFSRGSYYSINKANLDGDWKLIQSWKPTDQLGTRNKFVNIPLLESSSPGATLTLDFKGTAIGMAVVSGGDAGMVKYRIDNGPEKQIDLFTSWSNSLHLPWYVLFAAGLKNDQHTLTLSIADENKPESKGHACRIVNFLLNK